MPSNEAPRVLRGGRLECKSSQREEVTAGLGSTPCLSKNRILSEEEPLNMSNRMSRKPRTRTPGRSHTFINTNFEGTTSGTRGTINSHIATVIHRSRRSEQDHNTLNPSPSYDAGVVLDYCPACFRWIEGIPSLCQHVTDDANLSRLNATPERGNVISKGNSDPFSSCECCEIYPVRCSLTQVLSNIPEHHSSVSIRTAFSLSTQEFSTSTS